MREIFHLESKECGDCSYFSDSKVEEDGLKWISDLGEFIKQRLHFLHSLAVHQQMDTFFPMVLRDKKVDNYKLFVR